VTDVPEHLLRRSKAARDKAAGGSGDAGAEPSAPAAQASASEPGSEVATTAAAAAPAVVEAPPTPVPPYVAAAQRRPRVPRFAIPVLASLPVWALVYAGTLTKPASSLDPELAQGQKVYSSICSGCHGPAGEGGTGRPLGQVLKTFPNKADHIAWVHNGNVDLAPGTPYGDPKQGRTAHSGGYGTMPAFKDTLSDADIAAVVRYEREQIGGSEPQPSTDDDLNPKQGGATGTQSEGVTDTGGSAGGSDTNQARTSGGDVGDTSPQGTSNAPDNAAPSGQSNPGSQSGAGQSTSGGSKAGGGAGSGTGGDSTSTTAPK
jgi:mono/diheme cytochrome c family protein